MPNITEYQNTYINELKHQFDRFEHLIGRIHLGELGRARELFIKNFLISKLPPNTRFSTGFVYNAEKKQVTKQIDIIIWDGRITPLFELEDLIVLPPKAVFGILEVKSYLDSDNAKEVVSNASYNASVIDNEIFNGLWVYKTRYKLNTEHRTNFTEALEESKGALNHIALGPDKFIKYWLKYSKQNDNGTLNDNNMYSIYQLKGLAPIWLTGNLCEHVEYCLSGTPIDRTTRDILYPYNKEVRLLKDLELED